MTFKSKELTWRAGQIFCFFIVAALTLNESIRPETLTDYSANGYIDILAGLIVFLLGMKCGEKSAEQSILILYSDGSSCECISRRLGIDFKHVTKIVFQIQS